MAISYNTGTAANAGPVTHSASFTFTIPAGVNTGDVMLVAVECFMYTSASPSIATPTSGGGSWASIPPGLLDSGAASGFNAYGTAWQRVATASDPGSTFTVSFTGTAGSPDQIWWAAAMVSYAGANTSSPIDVSGGAVNVGGGASLTTASVMTGADNDWLVYLIPWGSYGTPTLTGPGGATQRQLSTPIADGDAAAYDSNGSVGASGTSIGGGVFSATNTGWWNGFTVGLAPAGASPPPPLSDIPHAQPGPAWLRLFKPWLQRPVPPIPATPAVNVAGGLSLAPLAFTAVGTQTAPDVPQITPGPFWLRLFKPWLPRPVPPLPATSAVNAAGGLTLAPLAVGASGAQTSPDIPQANPGPFWFRLFKPWVQRPAPPPPPSPGVTATGGLSLAPLAFAGQGAQTAPDQPQIQPGSGWLRFFKPWVQRPVPPIPAAQSVNAAGGLSLAPLAMAGNATITSGSPDVPQITPGPFWLRLFKPWIQRPAPPIPAVPAVAATGGLALAPLAIHGTAQGSPPPLLSAQSARWRWTAGGARNG